MLLNPLKRHFYSISLCRYQIKERKELEEGLIKAFKDKDIINSIEKFVNAVYENNDIYVGIREGNELYNKTISFGDIYMIEDSNESINNEKYKPESMLPNEGNYYYGSEEILSFDEGKYFWGIIGNNWFTNQTDDEFAEAIIFGEHNVQKIDCMLGSVRVNNPFNSKTYLRPGSLVVLQRVEFKKTKYLEVSSFLTHLYTEYNSESIWFFNSNENERYQWNG